MVRRSYRSGTLIQELNLVVILFILYSLKTDFSNHLFQRTSVYYFLAAFSVCTNFVPLTFFGLFFPSTHQVLTSEQMNINRYLYETLKYIKRASESTKDNRRKPHEFTYARVCLKEMIMMLRSVKLSKNIPSCQTNSRTRSMIIIYTLF